MKIFTIGFTKKSAESFFTKLLACIVALAAASFLRQGFQSFFEFRFQPYAKHNCLTCLT